MSEEWIEIVPAQRRAPGEAAYGRWLALHGLTDADVAHDLLKEIGRMVGGGDFVRYAIRASRLAELGLTSEARCSLSAPVLEDSSLHSQGRIRHSTSDPT